MLYCYLLNAQDISYKKKLSLQKRGVFLIINVETIDCECSCLEIA